MNADGLHIGKEDVSYEETVDYSKFSDKELDQARLMIKMFKSKKIKLHLKE